MRKGSNVLKIGVCLKTLLLALVAQLPPMVALTATAQAQQLTEKYTAERPVVIACDWDKPPYEFLDDQGQPAGSNIDVLRIIMKRLNIPCKFVMKEWGNALKTFERREADLIFANVNRYKGGEYVSTQIINYNRIRVAMTKDTVGIISVKTLEQAGVVLKSGDYSAMYFRDSDSSYSSRIEYQSPKVALTGLLAGDNKYFVWGEEPLKWKLRRLNFSGIYLNEVSIPVSEVHIIGRDRDLVYQIDDQYSRMKQSGELEQVLNKWYHPELVQHTTSSRSIYIILGLLLLVALIFFFNRLAKAHVRRMTRNTSELNEMMYKALHMGNYDVMEYDIKNNLVTNRYGRILPEKGLTFEEFTERIHPDQRQEFQQKMRQLLSGRARRFELGKRWNAGTDGQPRWLNFHGHAILELDEEGHPAYVVNAVHDVTHEVEEDKAAQELVLKYNCLANLPMVAVSFYSRDGWLIDLNDAMKDLCGFNNADGSDAERYWRNLNMFDIPLFRNALSVEDRDALRVCQHMHYPDLNLDRYIEFDVIPLLDSEGRIVNYVDTTIEVTEERNHIYQWHQLQREERAALSRTERQKRLLTYLLNKSGRYLIHSDLQHQQLTFFRTVGKPDYEFTFSEFEALLAEGEGEALHRLLTDPAAQTSQPLTVHVTRPGANAVTKVRSLTFSPVYDADGRLIGHEGVSTDISTLYHARLELAELERRAKDSVRLKSGFMASMTHELRTPLNAIVGFTGVLEALGDTEERAEYVRIIRNSSDMLQRLINDIIEASSITDGPTTLMPQEVNFASAFEDICLTLQQRVQDAHLTFIKDNPYATFMTTLDIGRVQQVMTNFVTNAVKFTKEGHIRLGYRYEDGGLYLYCEDTGIGIPPEKQPIIFDRFVKLDEFVQGTGMGLAICKSIAERCNGRIGVDSVGTGQGSTFWLWIPCECRS